MSLLQDPTLALRQIAWYMDSRESEFFPGAFLLAAGNLARQVLEQVAFILAFYGGLPQQSYLRPNGQPRTLDAILRALAQRDSSTGKTYLALARLKGPRIRKLARSTRSLHRWRRLLNEPSHFANPAAGRKLLERDLRAFVEHFVTILEPLDAYLITAAVNEIKSGGFIKAILTVDPSNKPGVLYTIRASPQMIHFKGGKFSLRAPVPIVVVNKNQELPYRWRRKVVVVQDSRGMVLQSQVVTSSGNPINMSSFAHVLSGFASDPIDAPALMARLRCFGFHLSMRDGVVTGRHDGKVRRLTSA
jgi:hypothetical protein